MPRVAWRGGERGDVRAVEKAAAAAAAKAATGAAAAGRGWRPRAATMVDGGERRGEGEGGGQIGNRRAQAVAKVAR